MLSRKTQNVLAGIFVIIAVVIVILAAVVFFRPGRLTGNKLLDCVGDDVQISRIRKCFDKLPEYREEDFSDAILFRKAVASKSASFCDKISDADSKPECLAVVKGDDSYCSQIKNPLTQAVCYGSLGKRDACNNLEGQTRNDCLADTSNNPEDCNLLPENERAFCFAIKKKQLDLCVNLLTYPQQTRCLANINPDFISALEELYDFTNFFEIVAKEKHPDICNLVKDKKFKDICLDEVSSSI